MSTWQGGLSRLHYEPEASWAVGPPIFNDATSYRVWFDNLEIENDRQDLGFDFISSDFKVDHTQYIEGGASCGIRWTFTLRYDGIHTNLQTMAIGDGVTSGAGPYTHTISLADALASMTYDVHYPRHDGTTTNQWINHTMSGCTVSSITWSHRAAQPLKCTVDWIGDDHTIFSTPQPASVGSMSAPTASIIEWHHKETDSGADTGIEIERQGIAPQELSCSAWEITLDNGIRRQFELSTNRLTSQPKRIRHRTVTGRVTCDSDAAWFEAMQAMGANSTTAQTDVDLRFRYEDPADSDLTWEMLLGNCRLLHARPVIPGVGLLTPTFEFRAHAQTGGANTNDPLELVTTTTDQGDGTNDWTDVIR